MVIGSTLAGRYAITDRIAGGGMGTVYAANDTRLNRRVAVKLLKDDLAGDDRFVERFRREARSAGSLSHPNVAGVFDYGRDDGNHFIVMELVEGRDLARVLREEGPLDPERAVRIATQVAAALGHAHAAGMVHRDVKPANVIVAEGDHVKVTDFGIARATGDSTLTATGSVLGTAQYISPEQAQGHPATARSDVYCLGIVLYEMLTGSVPFTGESAVAIAMRHASEEVPPPSALNRDVPSELDVIVARATAKDPAHRFDSGAEFAAALREVSSPTAQLGAPVGAPPPTEVLRPTNSTVYPIPGARWDPEKLGRTVLISFLVLGLIAVGLLLWVISAGDDDRASRDKRRTGATATAGGGENAGTTADIPETIVGLPYEEELRKLEEAGFDVTVETVESDADEGTIVNTEPPPGTTGVTLDTPITLYVSAGEHEDDEDDEDDEGPPAHSRGKAKGKDKDD